MSEDRIAGAVKQGFGHVQDAIGGLTGDTSTQAKGKYNEAAGSVQNSFGQAKDKAVESYYDLEDVLRNRPLVSIGIGVAIGFLISQLIRD